MPPLQSVDPGRKRRGDYPTPHWLVESVVANTVPDPGRRQRISVLDPACGDGRFLVAAARRLRSAGVEADLVGVDIDEVAVGAAHRALTAADVVGTWRVEQVDALTTAWGGTRFDVVVGNPPYLSQLAAATSRGGGSHHGGGPYADAAAEFLALAGRLARPVGGRIGMVLPQSILSSRDAAAVRAELDRRATITWSWWSPQRVFEAQVFVCALALETGAGVGSDGGRPWTHVVTEAMGVPAVPALTADGSLGDRARLTANFRDQYYGLVPAVVEDGSGPPLVTSGLVDPGHCAWGQRDVTFAKRRFARPTVDLAQLAPWMKRWADGLLVPKVLVANQTAVIEAVADPDGRWLPGVPVITVRPTDATAVWPVAAVLTSPVATAWAWHRAAGTGLSAGAVRLGPRWLADLPWPSGDLAPAVDALRDGDVVGCGRAVLGAYGVAPHDSLLAWWRQRLPDAGRVPGRWSHRR